MRTAGLAALFLAGAPVIGSAEPAPLTNDSVGRMPPDELARRVFGDLGHVMYPLPSRSSRGGASGLPLQALAFLTRPRGSYRAGVCQTDRIVVAFERTPFAIGPDPAVRPYRFQVYENYFVQDFADARAGGPPEDPEADAELGRTCAAIDPRERQLIVAESAFDVVGGIDALADLIEAAQAGQALAPMQCLDEQAQPVAENECLGRLSRLEPLKLYHARSIPGCDRRDPEVHCRWLEVFDYDSGLDIMVEYRRGGREPVAVRVKPSLDESSIVS